MYTLTSLPPTAAVQKVLEGVDGVRHEPDVEHELHRLLAHCLVRDAAVAMQDTLRVPVDLPLKPWQAQIVDRLGTVPDVALAREVGVSMSAVNLFRKQRGVQRWHAPPKTPQQQSVLLKSPRVPAMPAWVEGIRDRLGKEADAVLAVEVGRSKERVRQIRAKLGIPEAQKPGFRATPPIELTEEVREWLATLSSGEVAKRIGRSVSAVQKMRQQLGIPAPFKGSKVAAFHHLFGVVSDREIARRAGVKTPSIYAYRARYPELPLSPHVRKKG